MKKTIKSVTNFIYYGDEYLFLHRSKNKKIDPGKYNGVGGKVEPGENFIEAVIRETKKETGYVVKPKDIKFSGLIDFEEGYEDEWITLFFKIRVYDKKIPVGSSTDDGKLIWIHKNKVLNNGYDLVDDLYYCFEDIVKEQNKFFMTVRTDDKNIIIEEKTTKLNSKML